MEVVFLIAVGVYILITFIIAANKLVDSFNDEFENIEKGGVSGRKENRRKS